MPVYYLETSALLKRYKSEEGSHVVNELFDSKTDDEIFVTSNLSVLEMTSVPARLLKGKVLRRRQFERLIGTFVEDLSTYEVLVMPLQDGLVSESIEVLTRYPLRAADALHFATAQRAQRAAGDESFCLVSADKDIGEACVSYQVPLLNPELPSALQGLRAGR